MIFFPKMERELKKVGVTIQHMWEQYIAINLDGYRSSQFAHHYKVWSKRVNPVMHMNHKAGGKMYVDYAGKTLSIIENDTGKSKKYIFCSHIGSQSIHVCRSLHEPAKGRFCHFGRKCHAFLRRHSCGNCSG